MRLSQIIRKLTLLKEVIISAIFLLVNFLGLFNNFINNIDLQSNNDKFGRGRVVRAEVPKMR